jgi:hypothetical protein
MADFVENKWAETCSSSSELPLHHALSYPTKTAGEGGF